MKYDFKDPKQRTALRWLGFTEEEIDKEINDLFDKAYLSVTFHKEGVTVYLDKGCFKQIPEYKPNEWNEYPAVKPPMADCRYLVTLEGIIGATWVDIAKWSGERWEVNQGERVLAFRERPKPYLLNEIEDIDGLKKEGEDD